MLNLNKEELRKLQLIELELLKEFDRICRKHNIRYTLTGGTLLGAVRHGGFIPWDDDADVAMLRSEYNKFREVCKVELKDKYYFQDMKTTPGYRWGYGKLRKRDTIFLRENQEHMPYEQGVFMDIFPRDAVPDKWLTRKLHKFECFCTRKILWSSVGKIADKRWYMNKWFALVEKIVGDRVYKIYDSLVEKSSDTSTKLVRNLTFPVPNNRDGYERSGYEESIELEFEGCKFLVNSNYEKWLEQEFGDYMELPPEEKRKVHPVVQLKLE